MTREKPRYLEEICCLEPSHVRKSACRHAPLWLPHRTCSEIPSLTVNPVIGIVGRTMLVWHYPHDTLRHQDIRGEHVSIERIQLSH